MRSLDHALIALVLCASVSGAQQEPPRRLDLAAEATAPRQDTIGIRNQSSRDLRNRFVRDQTVLGFTVYAPAFAVMVGSDGVTGTAGYMVMAGGTFFAAAEITRHVQITEARHLMSSAMAMRTAGSALLIAGQSDMGAKQAAALTLLGGFAGTASGLVFGRGLTGGEAAATIFGHDLAWMTAFAITAAGDSDPFDTTGVDRLTSAVGWTAAGLGGYFAGRWYAGRARHNVTVGDVQTLWLGATIGALGGAATVASSSPNSETVASVMLAGGWLGVIGAERFLVRRFDHTRSEGNLLALGGGAGALMGMGVGILVSGEADRGGSATLGFATAGAIAGVAMAERYIQPEHDAGRLAFMDRISINPGALVAAAARQPGRHTLLSYTF